MKYLPWFSCTNLLGLTNLSLMSLLRDTHLLQWEINVHNSKKEVLLLGRPKSKDLLNNTSWNSVNGDGSWENEIPTICWISFQEVLMSHFKLGTNRWKVLLSELINHTALMCQITSSVIGQINWRHEVFGELFLFSVEELSHSSSTLLKSKFLRHPGKSSCMKLECIFILKWANSCQVLQGFVFLKNYFNNLLPL